MLHTLNRYSEKNKYIIQYHIYDYHNHYDNDIATLIINIVNTIIVTIHYYSVTINFNIIFKLNII